jgi:hypothetical protein
MPALTMLPFGKKSGALRDNFVPHSAKKGKKEDVTRCLYCFRRRRNRQSPRLVRNRLICRSN